MDIRRGSAAMPLRALTIWFALLLVAVANGGFREAVLIPRFGPHPGHIVVPDGQRLIFNREHDGRIEMFQVRLP
jgi:hypothetical protein